MKITMKKDNGLVSLKSIMIGDVFIRLESGSIYLKLENNHDKSMSKCVLYPVLHVFLNFQMIC